MLNTTIKTGCASVAALLLSGCLASGGSSAQVAIPTPVTPVPPAPPAAPMSPVAAAAPLTKQIPANTLSAPDSAGFRMTETMNALGTASTLAGPAVLLAATSLTAPLTLPLPLTPQTPTSATLSGGMNTSVPALAVNPAGGYTGAAANGQAFSLTSLKDNVLATTASPAAGLTYSDFGDWQLRPNIAAASSGLVTQAYWAGGTQLTMTMPVVGSATYTGVARASVETTSAGVTTLYNLSGDLTLTANFASKSMTGSIVNLTAVNNMGAAPVAAGAFNNVTLSGKLNGNAFNGAAIAGARPVGANPAAIAAGTSGNVAGHFYGPAANEASGVWGMSSSTVQVVGSFGAKQ